MVKEQAEKEEQIPNKEMILNNNKNIDYETILQNDAVKNIMNLLSITQNTGSILEAERIIFWLSKASGRYLSIEDKSYKRKSLTYDLYDEIMQKNQAFNDYKREHGTDLKTISSLNFSLVCDVLRIIYGIKDPEIVKRNWDDLLPVADGELYRIVNDFYNNWDLKPVMDHITEVISYTKRNLADEVMKRDDIFNKAKLENEKHELQTNEQNPVKYIEEPTGAPLLITKRVKHEEEHNIEIDNNGVLNII